MPGTIKIDRIRNEIHLYCPWAPGVPGACKSVSGAVWDKKKKCWKYPLLWQVCLEIRQKIAKPLKMEIELSSAMWNWAQAEKTRQEDRPDLASGEAVDLPVLSKSNPKLYQAMVKRPFQTVGAKFGAINREILLADDPGLGKTLQTIAMIEESETRGPILVVAPKAAVTVTWPREIFLWGNDNDECLVFSADIPSEEREAEIVSAFEDCEKYPDLRVWIIMNSHWLRTRVELDEFGKYVKDKKGAKIQETNMESLFKKPWSAVIVDESHTMLAGSTGNAKKWSQQRVGLGALSLADNGLRVAISGTPFRGKPENLYGTLQWLRPEIYRSYWKWVERHFHMGEDDWGAREVGGLVNKETFYKEAANVMLRRTKEEVAKDLPPKAYGGVPYDNTDPDSVVGVWLPMEKKQARYYASMVSKAETELKGGTITANGVLSEMIRLKQFANSCMDMKIIHKKHTLKPHELRDRFFEIRTMEPYVSEFKVSEMVPLVEEWDEQQYFPTLPSNKFDWIVQFLTDRDLIGKKSKGKQKVIITSQFTKLINLFAFELRKMGTPCYVLTGETSDKIRLQIATDFQENPDSPKVFLLNTKAGGVSLTLDAADDLIIIDETYVFDDQIQVEDRIHRLSRTDHNVTIWYLRSLETIDENLGVTNTERRRVCSSIIDGVRGDIIAKKLLQRKGK